MSERGESGSGTAEIPVIRPAAETVADTTGLPPSDDPERAVAGVGPPHR
jgi:hypothetical protein